MTTKLNINGIDELDINVTGGSSSATVSGSVATLTFNPPSGSGGGVNKQTGTSYTVLITDNGLLLTFSNAAPVAVTLPLFGSTWFASFENRGAGAVTITPTGATVDGAASITLSQNQGVVIFCDGTNYFTQRGLGAGASYVAGSGITIAGSTISADSNILSGSAGVTIDGAGTTPPTGSYGFVQVDYNATIIGWSLAGNATGSCQITVKKCADGAFPATVSIVASAPPTLAAQQKNENTTLTGWTTTINAGDWLEFNLDSVSTITRVNFKLKLQRI